jgi:hypothetical protein
MAMQIVAIIGRLVTPELCFFPLELRALVVL